MRGLVVAVSACALLGEGCDAPRSLMATVTPPSNASSNASPPPDVAEIEEPAATVCELMARPHGDSTRLAVYANAADVLGGEALAAVDLESARVRLLSGDGSAGFATHYGAGLTLSGYVRLRDIPLSASRALAGGLIMPRLGRLEIVLVEPHGVRVRLPRHRLIDPTALPIEEHVRCDELSADGERVELPAGTSGVRLRGRGVELRPSPSDADHGGFALETPAGDDLVALELERRADFVRILLPSPDGDLSGWVASGAVRPQAGPLPRRAELEPTARAKASPTGGTRCARALRFAVDTRDGPLWLGEVGPGVSITLKPRTRSGSRLAGWRWARLASLSAPVLVRRFDLEESQCDETAASKLTPSEP